MQRKEEDEWGDRRKDEAGEEEVGGGKGENEGERTMRETKTYLSQVTEGQKQRVTLEACDRAGSGKTCGKIQTRPPVHPRREGREEEEEKKRGIIKDLVGFAMHQDRLADK